MAKKKKRSINLQQSVIENSSFPFGKTNMEEAHNNDLLEKHRPTKRIEKAAGPLIFISLRLDLWNKKKE